MRGLALLLACATFASCLSAPPAPPPGTAQVWGEVAAVPPAGMRSGGGLNTYDANGTTDHPIPPGTTLVDYEDPGAVVVELQGGAPAPGGALSLVAGPTGITPAYAAVGAQGTLAIENRSDGALTFAVLRAGELVGEVAVPPGAVSSPVSMGGVSGEVEVSCYERDEPAFAVRVVVAEGPYVLRAAGAARYVIDGVTPGRYELVARHPRFPELRRSLELVAGEQLRLDLELGLGGLPRVPPAR